MAKSDCYSPVLPNVKRTWRGLRELKGFKYKGSDQKKPEPRVLEVGASVVGGYHVENREPLPTCRECGSLSLDHSDDVLLGLVRSLLSPWNGTDLLEIRGAPDIYVTEDSDKLQALGFTNTLLEELSWHEGQAGGGYA